MPPTELSHPRGTIDWLVAIVRRLLAADGCPWDREQTLETLRPFLLEESYEVIDAIDEGDPAHLKEELGDLLFQIVFQAELAGFEIAQVLSGIGQKLIRRHPHVFGDARVEDARQVRVNWEQLKRQERRHSGAPGALAGVPRSMPALERAHRLTIKAAAVGFDWPDIPSVRRKVQEELDELDEISPADAANRESLDHELGDLLFAIVNWGRKLELDPEQSLRRANARFERRFGHIEARLASSGRTAADSSLAEMDRLWQEAKAQEAKAREPDHDG